MANVEAVKPSKQTIVLGDGVEREVKFTLNAMAELEEKYGTIEGAFQQIQEKSSISAIRFLLWLIVVPNDNEEALTEKQIGNLIDISNLNSILGALMDIFEMSMPEMQAAMAPNQEAQNW